MGVKGFTLHCWLSSRVQKKRQASSLHTQLDPSQFEVNLTHVTVAGKSYSTHEKFHPYGGTLAPGRINPCKSQTCVGEHRQRLGVTGIYRRATLSALPTYTMVCYVTYITGRIFIIFLCCFQLHCYIFSQRTNLNEAWRIRCISSKSL
jgi:hypothetical protein